MDENGKYLPLQFLSSPSGNGRAELLRTAFGKTKLGPFFSWANCVTFYLLVSFSFYGMYYLWQLTNFLMNFLTNFLTNFFDEIFDEVY